MAVSTTVEAAFPASTAVPGRTPPCALVIFGASGDLTARKLLPALGRLAADGALAPKVTLIGVGAPVPLPGPGDIHPRRAQRPRPPRPIGACACPSG
jgi:Glucose-6-phosphate dehydrogenase, NAD binding domain